MSTDTKVDSGKTKALPTLPLVEDEHNFPAMFISGQMKIQPGEFDQFYGAELRAAFDMSVKARKSRAFVVGFGDGVDKQSIALVQTFLAQGLKNRKGEPLCTLHVIERQVAGEDAPAVALKVQPGLSSVSYITCPKGDGYFVRDRGMTDMTAVDLGYLTKGSLDSKGTGCNLMRRFMRARLIRNENKGETVAQFHDRVEQVVRAMTVRPDDKNTEPNGLVDRARRLLQDDKLGAELIRHLESKATLSRV
jgi:hypothetical protein